MLISYNWLKDLIDLDLSVEETAAQLTRVGLAVDGVHSYGNDFVIDIDLTSNRPDCLSHLGVARELRVITGKQLTAERQRRGEEPEIPVPAILAPDIVKIENPEFCYRFTARIIRGVKIGPSPEWLVKRLEALGERSINNVADITNYVMLELGQPMHAFDLDKLAENRIVVRTAREGETLTTLDEVERELDSSMLMICDAEKPVAIGGVMGGLDSSITDSTTNVLLEVAYFDRVSIRRTSRKLNLATEASYRFERGADINNLQNASDRAANLICDIAGGKLAEFVDVYPKPLPIIEVESNDIAYATKRLTGLDVPEAECIRILNALGISVKESEIQGPKSKTFVAPSWRHDIAIEEDLVEEIARHVGYENIADELPPAYHAGEYQETEETERKIRRMLADLGYDEAMGYSFIDAKHDDIYQLVPCMIDERVENKNIELQDAVIEGAVRMRPTLLPGLVESARVNFNRQNRNLKLFEIGRVFAASLTEEGLPTERELLSILVTGNEMNEGRAMPGRELDFYDAKGGVEAALERAGFADADFEAAEIKHLRPGQSAVIKVNGNALGSVGQLNEEIAANYKFRQPVYVAEIDLQAVLAAPRRPAAYAPLPRFPAIVRDVSFTVNRDISFTEIRDAIKTQNIEICRSIEFVDLYEGKGLSEHERSITIRLQYRSGERTLIDDEVEAVHEQVLRTLEDNLKTKRRF